MVPEGTMVVGGLLAGVTVNEFPMQMEAVWLGMTGLGLIVTVTVKVLPEQVPEIGVTV